MLSQFVIVGCRAAISETCEQRGTGWRVDVNLVDPLGLHQLPALAPLSLIRLVSTDVQHR
jgi:hypothetical protein